MKLPCELADLLIHTHVAEDLPKQRNPAPGKVRWTVLTPKDLHVYLALAPRTFHERLLTALEQVRDRFLRGLPLGPDRVRIVYFVLDDMRGGVPEWAATPVLGSAPNRRQHRDLLDAIESAGGRSNPTYEAAALQASIEAGHQRCLFYLHPALPPPPPVGAASSWRPLATPDAMARELRLHAALVETCSLDIATLWDKLTKGARASPRAVLAVPKPSAPPRELLAWMTGNHLLAVLEDSLRDTDLLLDDGGALAVDEDVDFGLKEVAVADGESADPLDEWDLPRIPSDRVSHALRRWLLDAAQVYTRQVTVSNRTKLPVSLVAASVQPSADSRFFALDDHGVVGRGAAAPFAADPSRIVLAPGQRYPFTVLFKVPTSAATSLGETGGLFTAMLLVVSWSEPPVGAREPRFASERTAAWKPGAASRIDVTACRVTGGTTRSSARLRSLLDAGAEPFVPRQLRNVFCALGQRPPHRVQPFVGFPHPDVYTPPGFVMTAPPPCAETRFNVFAPGTPPRSLSANKFPIEESDYDASPISFLMPADMRAPPSAANELQAVVVGEPDVYVSKRDFRVWPQPQLGSLYRKFPKAGMATTAALFALTSARFQARLENDLQIARADHIQSMLASVDHEFAKHQGQAPPPEPRPVDELATRFRRLIHVEGLAMLQESFTFDLFDVVPKLAVFAKQGRRYTLASQPPWLGRPSKDKNTPAGDGAVMTYRGPSLAALERHTTTVAADPSGRRYLLALHVPGMLENRPAVVVGSRVHLAYGASNAEDVCFVLDQSQAWCLLSAPLWLAVAAANASQLPVPAAGGAVHSTLQPMHVRFALDRTPLQRMHMAMLLNTTLPGGGVVPPAPDAAERRARPNANPCYVHDPAATLPDDLFSDPAPEAEAQRELGMWHAAAAPDGRLTDDVLEAIDTCAATLREIGAVPLNSEQRAAVASFVVAGAGRKPFTLFGPPGTGKTVTLVETALQLLAHDPDNRLLLCAPQSYSADLLCSGLASAGITPTEMLRVVDPRSPTNRTRSDVLKFCLLDAEWEAFRWPTVAEMASKRVIVSTCIAAGFFFRTTGNLFQRPFRVTHVLVDEAGQAPLPEAVLPLCMADPKTGACMLAGDPQQLGPVTRSRLAQPAGLAVSLLERLITYYRRLPLRWPSRRFCVMLRRNYRSHARLLQLPSDLFYGGQLMPCAAGKHIQLPKWRELLPIDHNHGEGDAEADARGDEDAADHAAGKSTEEPIGACNTLMYGVLGQEVRDGSAATFFNPQEAEVVAALVASLLSEHAAGGYDDPVTAAHVGVICTCRAQVVRVRLLLREGGLAEVRVGTVDDFQGQEARCVFISTVRTRPDRGLSRTGLDTVGFFSNPKRFNVAITRARALLVVVGHPTMLLRDKCWSELVRFCVARGAVRGSGASMLQTVQHEPASVAYRNLPPGTPAPDSAADDDPEARVAAELQGVAQTALLGLGLADRIYPDVPANYNAGEEQWRIAL